VIVIKVIHADSAEKERLMQMFKPVPPSAFLAVSAGDKTLDWEKLPPGNGENDRENILKAVRAFLVKHFSQ